MRYLAISLLLALILIPSAAVAQETTAKVLGQVTDDEGNPVGNAKLTFISPELQGDRVVESGDDGHYLAALLPPGAYVVTVAAPGKQNVEYTFRLRLGESFPLNIVVREGEQLVEEVKVYGTASKLATTTQGENFEFEEQVEGLPMQNRTLEFVALYAPNISFGPTTRRVPTENTDLAIAGAPSMDTLVLLDGAEISDPLFSSGTVVYFEDALQELQVMTSGVSAKYGRFQGGVLNAITKGGSNEYTASFRYEFSREDWNGTTPLNESQSSDLQETFWASTGGRVIRDHLWYFAGGRTIPSSTTDNNTLTTNVPYSTSDEEDRWQIRLTGAINPNHVIDVSHLDFERTRSGRAGLPAGDEGAVGNRADPREMDTFAYQGVLTPSLFLDVKATAKDAAIASGGDPAKGSPFIDWNNFTIYNNHWWDFTDQTQRNNETASANFTQVVNTSWGNHTLEYGYQFVDSETAGDNKQSPTDFNFISYDSTFVRDVNTGLPVVGGPPVAFDDLRFDVLSTEDNQRLQALPLGGGQNIENTALYVQDTLQINDRWRVDLGLRWDDYDGSGPLPQFGLGYDVISPRVAVTYNLSEDWQIQGFFGEYTGRLNDNWVQSATAVGDAPGLTYQYTGPDLPLLTRAEVETVLEDTHPGCAAQPSGSCWDLVLDVNDPDQPTTFLSGDPSLSGLGADSRYLSSVESPYARDFNFQIKRALPRNSGTVVFQYQNREFVDLVDDFFGSDVTGISPVMVTDPFGSGAMFPADIAIWQNNPDAMREYEAFTVTFDYRPSATWSIGGNYTLSETTGNYEGEGANTPGEGSALGDYPSTRLQQDAAPFGFLDEDVKHRVNAWANYRFDFGRSGNLVLGSIFQYHSGRPFNTTAFVPRASDPGNCCASSSYEKFFGGRGVGRYEGAWNLDLSARYEINIWKKLGFWVKGAVVNVTNEDGLIEFNTAGSGVANPVTGIVEFVPGGNFGNPDDDGDYQRPREYVFTAGLRW